MQLGMYFNANRQFPFVELLIASFGLRAPIGFTLLGLVLELFAERDRGALRRGICVRVKQSYCVTSWATHRWLICQVSSSPAQTAGCMEATSKQVLAEHERGNSCHWSIREEHEP